MTIGFLANHDTQVKQWAMLPDTVAAIRNKDMLSFEVGYGGALGHLTTVAIGSYGQEGSYAEKYAADRRTVLMRGLWKLGQKTLSTYWVTTD